MTNKPRRMQGNPRKGDVHNTEHDWIETCNDSDEWDSVPLCQPVTEGSKIMDVKEVMESEFDATDADVAMQLAYASLSLCRYVKRAVDSNAAGLRMGRDTASDLTVSVYQVLEKLGVLGYGSRAEDHQRSWESL